MQKIEIRAHIHAIGVRIKRGDDAAVFFMAHLIMPAARQFARVRPLAAVFAGRPVQLAAIGVFCKTEEKSTSRYKPRLRIGELALKNLFKGFDGKRFATFENITGTMPPAAADKNPDVSGIINGEGWIIMRIIHIWFLIDDHRFGRQTGFVIVIRDHRQKFSFVRRGGAAVDKKRLVGFFAVNRQRMVFGRVGAESARIFIAILGFLSELKPDALVAVDLCAAGNLAACGHSEEECNEDCFHCFRVLRFAFRLPLTAKS